MVRQRNWGKSNAFSEGHRTCLPGNFCLWDIDGFLLDENRDPCAIYEGKYKSSNLWWKVNNGKLEKTNNPNLDIINTENRVYVEDILNRTIGENSFTGVFVRTEGEKVCELDPFGAYLSFRLKVHKILVNDIFEDNTVYFKNNDVVVKSSLDESQSGNWYQDWIDLGIL